MIPVTTGALESDPVSAPRCSKLDAETMRLSADRLSAHPPPRAPLPPLLPRRTISSDRLRRAVIRLCDEAVAARKQRSLSVEKNDDNAARSTIKLDADALSASLDRLYTQSIQNRQVQLKTLKHKYELEDLAGSQPPDAKGKRRIATPPFQMKHCVKLGVEEIKMCNERLYSKSMNTSREKREKLFEKYVVATELPKIYLSKDELQACAKRLHGS